VKKLEMREELLGHIEQAHFIKIEREKIDENPLHCIPLSNGEKVSPNKKFC